MTNESEEYNHPMRVVWRDLLRKHMELARKGDEENRQKLLDFIFQYEELYHEILENELQARSA